VYCVVYLILPVVSVQCALIHELEAVSLISSMSCQCVLCSNDSGYVSLLTYSIQSAYVAVEMFSDGLAEAFKRFQFVSDG